MNDGGRKYTRRNCKVKRRKNMTQEGKRKLKEEKENGKGREGGDRGTRRYSERKTEAKGGLKKQME